jgi:ribosome assembly protein YihI (activator of Der GTPase)
MKKSNRKKKIDTKSNDKKKTKEEGEEGKAENRKNKKKKKKKDVGEERSGVFSFVCNNHEVIFSPFRK